MHTRDTRDTMSTTTKPSRTLLVWIRHELRVRDNPLLSPATALPRLSKEQHDQFQRLVPVFVLDPRQLSGQTHEFGLARYSSHRSRFLFEALSDLKSSLQRLGSDLVIRSGTPSEVLAAVAKDTGATDAVWAFHVGTEEAADAQSTREALGNVGVAVHPDLWDMTLLNPLDLPFTDIKKNLPLTFTGFRKAVEARRDGIKVRPIVRVDRVLPLPPQLNPGEVPSELPDEIDSGWAVDALGKDFRVKVHEGIDGRQSRFTGGETVAQGRIEDWFWTRDALRRYKETRNGLLGDGYASQLSPYLALGCISARSIYWEVKRYERERGLQGNENTYWLIFELLWRDYFKFLGVRLGASLFHLHGGHEQQHHGGYHHPWSRDGILFRKWCLGETGFDLIDAAMNELRVTGFMSNRMRQVVASFLTKDLGLDWRLGAEWFESQLVDSDVTSNYGNWQYVAGVGVDPRENRYFNLDKQAMTYDPDRLFRTAWLGNRSPTAVRKCIDRLGTFSPSKMVAGDGDEGSKRVRPANHQQHLSNAQRKAMTNRNAKSGGRDIRQFFHNAKEDC